MEITMMKTLIDAMAHRHNTALRRACKDIAALIGKGAYVKLEYVISERRSFDGWSASATRFDGNTACECVGGLHIAHDPLAALEALRADVAETLSQKEAA
jgi:hypothetical protein